MQNQPHTKPIKTKKHKRKSNIFQYILLFAVVFSVTLFGMSYFVDVYSPDVDVAIGNSEPVTLTGSYINQEERTIDERLRWIQEEDELPSAGANEPKLYSPEEEEQEIADKGIIKKIIELPKKRNYDEDIPQEETVAQKENEQKKDKIDYLKMDFRRAAEDSGVITQPKKNTPSKVFIGKFSTVEEAVETQNNIVRENLEVLPFVKSVNNYYVVQVGSFSEKEKADALALTFKQKGYPARVVSEN